MFVVINHTDLCFAIHASKPVALSAAKSVRSLGAFATVWTLDEAVKFGQLIGLKEIR